MLCLELGYFLDFFLKLSIFLRADLRRSLAARRSLGLMGNDDTGWGSEGGE
jgi:hypothetical protein